LFENRESSGWVNKIVGYLDMGKVCFVEDFEASKDFVKSDLRCHILKLSKKRCFFRTLESEVESLFVSSSKEILVLVEVLDMDGVS